MEPGSLHAPASETVNTHVLDQRTQNCGSRDSCYMYHRIGEVRKFMKSKGVGLDDACTDAAGRTCWLCRNTTPWNKLLAPLSLELVVSGPGELCLRRPINDDSGKLSDVNARDDGAFAFAWLSKHHRCVQTICLHADFLTRMPAYWLNLALCSSANLRHLKLRGEYWNPFSKLKLSEVLQSLTKLESFELIRFPVTPVLASSIAALLRRNKGHLARFGFEYNTVSQRTTATILSGLMGCTALTELSFCGSVLVNRNARTMARVVREARVLKKLSLHNRLKDGILCGHIAALHYGLMDGILWAPIAAALKDNTSLEELSLRVDEAPLGPVFDALEANTTLRHLDMRFRVWEPWGPPTVSGLANLLRCNKGLRCVVLRDCDVRDDAAEHLADAIAGNSTLETLDLTRNAIGFRGVAAFCAALQKNKTLKTVPISMITPIQGDRRDLAHLLNRSNCYGRIVVPWENADLPPLTAALALASQSPSELSFDMDCLSSTLLCELFSALAGNTEVKTLKVTVEGYEADKADALCKTLVANQSIKRLEVHGSLFGFDESLFVDVSKALVINSSITDLIIDTCDTSLDFSKTFSSMLTQNKTLTTIALHCHSLGTKQLDVLSQGMIENRTVTSFRINVPLTGNCAAFRLHEAVRRNIAFLHMASQFVMRADVTKHCAQAFETLRWTSSLVSHVAKVSGKSEQEAAAALVSAEKYIRSHYLFVTGVVREAVRCYPGTGKQADALNDYCWQAIAEYLKVSDVPDR